jgi:hypothetical protein
MISRDQRSQYPEVDWSVYDHQQDPTPQKSPELPKEKGNRFMEGVDKFNKGVEDYVAAPGLGFMQEVANIPSGLANMGKHYVESDPIIQRAKKEGKYNLPDVPYFDVAPHTGPADAGRALSLALGMKLPAEAAEIGLDKVKNIVSKGMDYLHPETAAKKSEQFRSMTGEGTSSENIENLGKRAQFAKESSQKEALIPKTELYKQEGRSNVYDVNPKGLPEGNINKVADMIAPGEKYGDSQAKALSNALKYYRSGKIDKKIGGDPLDIFLHKSEDIFGIPELPNSAASKIEDALYMPTKRESRYFGDEDVESVYSKKGKLQQLHDKYERKPILANYDKLQSALKVQQRKLKPQAKLSDTAELKLDQIDRNIKNLNADKEDFMQTLPEKMQNLENEFRKKYQEHMSTFEKGKKGTGASETLRNLAEGKHNLVTDAQVQKVFAHPTAADKKIILAMGPSAAKNALYSALQRVKEGDAEGMANTIIDLKRTKGFDNIVTKEMLDWANNMLKYLKSSESIRRNLGNAGRISTHMIGAGTGAMLGGPVGAAVGGSLPFAWKGAKYIAERFKK